MAPIRDVLHVIGSLTSQKKRTYGPAQPGLDETAEPDGGLAREPGGEVTRRSLQVLSPTSMSRATLAPNHETIQNELLLARCTIKHLGDDLGGNLMVSYEYVEKPLFAAI